MHRHIDDMDLVGHVPPEDVAYHLAVGRRDEAIRGPCLPDLLLEHLARPWRCEAALDGEHLVDLLRRERAELQRCCRLRLGVAIARRWRLRHRVSASTWVGALGARRAARRRHAPTGRATVPGSWERLRDVLPQWARGPAARAPRPIRTASSARRTARRRRAAAPLRLVWRRMARREPPVPYSGRRRAPHTLPP